MKFKKQKKGISLIVLIITIIIMIILASAIIISLSNNGIIDKARKAVDLSNESGITEMLEITVSLLKQENKLNEENLKSELEKSFNEEVEVTKDTDGSYTVGVKGIYFTIEDDKIIKGKYDKWDGTKLEPTSMTDNEIHIYKASELKWVQEQVTEGNSFEGYTIYLENNLDLGARESSGDTLDEKWKTDANKAVKWTPIGKTEELGLKAKFEGNNHVIKGVYVEETSKYNGIFGICYSEIQDLSIKNSYIEGTGYTGGIAGVVVGNVTNCHNINTTVITIECEEINTGGVVGIMAINGGDIKNCTNSGNIISYGKYEEKYSQVGGIVGRAKQNISNCENNGTVFASGSHAGGISGICEGSVKDCINRGKITIEGDYYVAGISGVCSGSGSEIVENCINNGDISGVNQCGGIVGAMSQGSKIINCYNTGNIVGNDIIGGILGNTASIDSDATEIVVEKCYNKGKVTGKYYAGGIIGRLYHKEGWTVTVKLCYNKGNVTGEEYTGSIIGNEYADNNNTYSHLYYLSSLNLGAINGVDNVDNNVTSTTKDINTFEEFKTWIAQFE